MEVQKFSFRAALMLGKSLILIVQLVEGVVVN